MSPRVLIVDDHGVVRAGLRALLKEHADFQVGEAATSDEGLRAALELKPDVVLMDVSIPGMGGLDLTRLLREKIPGTRIIILTVHEDGAILRAALTAGASGYVVKRAVGPELLSAIQAVVRGEIYVHPSMTRDLLDMKEPATPPRHRGGPEHLWLRAAYPRLPYDQLMGFGWKVLFFPLALLNIIVTAVLQIFNLL